MILFIVIVLPAGAFFGTVFYQNNKQAFDELGNGARLLAVMYGPGDAEQRAASRKVDEYMMKLNTGTMTREEQEFWASEEGQAELADMISDSINLDELQALGREIYQTEQN